ncbi:MAG: FG-GAP repeat protein [Chitinophagaceae bacterium]
MKKLLLVIYVVLVNNNSEAQNVGIGTTVPLQKLHVAGNIKADTLIPNAVKLIPNAGVGKILTSDDEGNANWIAASSANGGVGFGAWGDCSVNNISEYNPVADATGAANDGFGNSVSISGNYAIAGAYKDDVGVNADQGSASFFQYNGTNWLLMQKLTDETGEAGDLFGYSVSICGNYAIVGTPSDDVGANVNQGSVSIYQYNGTNWVLMEKITDATGAADDNFGIGVSISGNYAIAGAYTDDVGTNTNQGSASIYQFNGTNWVLMEKITDAAGAAFDQLGYSVSISGNYAIAGASTDDVGATADQGSAIIFHYNGSNWVLVQKITDATGAASDYFGNSVSISGNYVIVGAYYDDVGANANQGSASIFQFNGTNWVLMQKISDVAGAISDNFGYSVFLSENYAIVGTPNDDVGTNVNQGSTSIYLRVGLGWQKLQYVIDPFGASNDQFGNSTSIDASTKRFLNSSPNYAGNSGKVIFGKIN